MPGRTSGRQMTVSSGGLGLGLQRADGGAEQQRARAGAGIEAIDAGDAQIRGQGRAWPGDAWCRAGHARQPPRFGLRSPPAGRWRSGCAHPGQPAAVHRAGSCRPWPLPLRPSRRRRRNPALPRPRQDPPLRPGRHRPCRGRERHRSGRRHHRPRLRRYRRSGARHRRGAAWPVAPARPRARPKPWRDWCHDRRRRSPRPRRRAGWHDPGSCRASPRSGGQASARPWVLPPGCPRQQMASS